MFSLAELEKVQKEIKLVMYKELNLSIAEQRFIEEYADKMESLNQELDKMLLTYQNVHIRIILTSNLSSYRLIPIGYFGIVSIFGKK